MRLALSLCVLLAFATCWDTSTFATPEDNGDFTMDLWLSPGGSIYVVTYTRLFNPHIWMETVLMRYLPDGRRLETHYLPSSGDSYALSGKLVPGVDGRSFFILTEEGDSVWVAKYLLPSQRVWTCTYKLPDAQREFCWDAATDQSGNLYVLAKARMKGGEAIGSLTKISADGEKQFAQEIAERIEHLLVTDSEDIFVVCEYKLLCFAPNGNIRWQRQINRVAPISYCLPVGRDRLAVLDAAVGQKKARLRVFDRNGQLLLHHSVPIPIYHDEQGILYSCETTGNRFTVIGYDLQGRVRWKASTPVLAMPDELLFQEMVYPGDPVTIVKDRAGNVYLIATVPSLAIAKWDPKGNLIYFKRHRLVGGADDGYAVKALVDPKGNLYIGMSMINAGRYFDSMLVKINSRGKIEWTRAYDSTPRVTAVSSSQTTHSSRQ